MKSACHVAVLVFSLLLLSRESSFGQASESEMRNFPMPPPSGFVASKTFNFVGDYGYYTAPTSAVPGQSANASDYKYVHYAGIAGKRVYVYGGWGPTPIPAPVGGGDACYHAHASYAVWGRYEATFFWIRWSGWTFFGGGGMSGTRNASDRCVFSTNNALSSLDSRFGWGQSVQIFEPHEYNFWIFRLRYVEAIVGALSNTHG